MAKQSVFESVSEDIVRRLIFRSWGLEKVGKNHFGFTAPGPIFGQYFDPGGIEGVAQKFLKAPLGPKEIKAIQYRFNKKTDDQEAAIKIRDKFVDDYAFALTKARTIQWDETELWELFRFAEFGKESDTPREYGPLNGMYRGLLQDAYDAGVNLQLIQKVKEKWVNNKPSGIMEPIGFKQANYIVQVNLEHSWTPEGGFNVKVVNCRQNTELWGEDYGAISFAELGCLVFPDSEQEEWE
jgi:hypothetical protein